MSSLDRDPDDGASNDDGPSDAVLLQRGAHGDGLAFERLVRRWADRVHGFLWHVLRDSAAIDDASQQTFVNVFERAATFDARQSFAAWLMCIARNVAIDRMRRLRLERTALTDARDAAAPCSSERDPHENAELRESSDAFEAALAALDEPFRTTFVLREVEGLSYEEIGAVTDVPAKTVSTRLHRAREQLRVALGLGIGARRRGAEGAR